jgi:Zn-dependent M16 (insulinase) family peptidase
MKGVDCNDRPRIQELLLQHGTELQNRLTKNALTFAIQTSLSGLSSASFVYDQWNGLSYYQSILEWVKKPETLADELVRIQEILLARGSPQLIISCEQEQFDLLKEKKFFDLPEKLPKRPITTWENNFTLPKPKPQARFISAPVAFTARGQRTVAYQDPRSPFILLATELLENCHLHKEIREKGGAYGSGASYAPHTGNFHFYSFRDPHLAKTIDEFQKSLEKISNGKFTKSDLEEAKFGVIQAIDAPVPPGNRAMTAYSWKRAGRTAEDRQNFRNAILSASKKDVAQAVKELLLPDSGLIVSFIGENLFKKEQKKLKSSLEVIAIIPGVIQESGE